MATTPTTPANTSGPTLTEREQHVLVLTWKCFRTVPEVDLDKLAELGGWKNKASANTMLYGVKKKLGLLGVSGDAGGSSASSASPAAGKKRAAAAAKGDTPKKRGRKGKMTDVKMDADEEPHGEEEGKGEVGLNVDEQGEAKKSEDEGVLADKDKEEVENVESKKKEAEVGALEES